MYKKLFYESPTIEAILVQMNEVFCQSTQVQKNIEGMSAGDNGINDDNWY